MLHLKRQQQRNGKLHNPVISEQHSPSVVTYWSQNWVPQTACEPVCWQLVWMR